MIYDINNITAYSCSKPFVQQCLLAKSIITFKRMLKFELQASTTKKYIFHGIYEDVWKVLWESVVGSIFSAMREYYVVIATPWPAYEWCKLNKCITTFFCCWRLLNIFLTYNYTPYGAIVTFHEKNSSENSFRNFWKSQIKLAIISV